MARIIELTYHPIKGCAGTSVRDAVLTTRGLVGYAKLATRCVVTTIDQESGMKAGPEPLRALAGYRRVASARRAAVLQRHY